MSVCSGISICLESKMTKNKNVVWQVNEYTHVFKKIIITFQTGNTLGQERKLCNDHVFTGTEIMNDHNDREMMDLPVCSL